MAKKRPKSAASFVQKSGQKSGQRPKKVGKIGKICTDEAGLVSLWPKKVGFCPVLKKKVGREFWQKMAKNGQKWVKNGQKWGFFGVFWVILRVFHSSWPKTHFYL